MVPVLIKPILALYGFINGNIKEICPHVKNNANLTNFPGILQMLQLITD